MSDDADFDAWDLIQGKIPANATQEFRTAVQSIRLMLDGQTKPELEAALGVIRNEQAEWLEYLRGESHEEIQDRGIPQEWLAHLWEEVVQMRESDPSLPVARPLTYFAMLALDTAVMAVAAMCEKASRQAQMENGHLPDDLNESRRELLGYLAALRKSRRLADHFIAIAQYAERLFQENSKPELTEPPIDLQSKRRIMAAFGRRGAAVANRKRREIREYVETLFRDGWLNNRWPNPRQAALELLPLARAKAEALHVSHCLDGQYDRALKTVYDAWIRPLSKKLRRGEMPHSAADGTTAVRRVE